jgi:hypothetical protein
MVTLDDEKDHAVFAQNNLGRPMAPDLFSFLDCWSSARRTSLVPTLDQFCEVVAPIYGPHSYIVELAKIDVSIRFQGAELVKRWKGNRLGESLTAVSPTIIGRAPFRISRTLPRILADISGDIA